MNPFFLFLFALALVAIIYWFKNASQRQGITALKGVLVILGLGLLILIVTGRLPLFSGIPVLLLGIFRKFALSRMLIPLIKLLAGKSGAQKVVRSSINMDDDQALQILGLSVDPSREEIVQAHRKIMRELKNSGDVSDIEATKIDLAREHLIKKSNITQ
ncbi:MAG: hypothetical protein OFPI_17290 [Osedax symbiont Rs2]|nr:MAG: hypothetical protein OFPI_17290 [Osedax symbiont Rs2]